jgi:geranylgeranyl pyrophosphate synthase
MELASLDADLRTCALEDVWHYAVRGPSKKTRSKVLFAAEAAARGGGGDPDPRVDLAAAAVEMFHLASLPHDDLMDGSEVRRGVESIPTRFGAPLAAAAGGLFIGRALTLFAQCGEEAVAVAAETTERMCEGQMLELRDRYDTGRTATRCLDTIKGKTAGMFWLAAKLGAILASSGEATQGRLEQYGLALGVGFQLIDDLLDIAGDERLTGKPRGTDLRNGNYTLAVIYALEEASDLLDLLQSDAAAEAVGWRIRQTNAIARAGVDARRWIDEAKDAVRSLRGAGPLLGIADVELERLAAVHA